MPFWGWSGKLTCFYCGCRSAHPKSSGLGQFTCSTCQAENFLDEGGILTPPPDRTLLTVSQNGEITDPPVSVSSSSQNTRYTQPKAKISIPYLDALTPATTDDLFCQTCRKNQHLYTESLAAFYPSPTRGDFEEFERAEREYREGLEERYPLVCEACEPKVRAKLGRANYDAKADNMRRIRERTRNGRPNEATSWKGWIIGVGGWMWLTSWLCQLVWNVCGLLPATGSSIGSTSTLGCMNHTLRRFTVTLVCLEKLQECPAYYGLFLGLLSLWWHPKRWEILDKRYGTVLGLSEYYKLQVLSFAVRSAAWYWFPPAATSDADTVYGLHLLLTVFSLLAILFSYHTITIDYTPKVSFKGSPEPLLKHSPNPLPLQRGFNDPITRPQTFSINDLAPKAQHPQTQRLPTPPPEADYNDPSAMEWTPSKPIIQPRYLAPFKPPQQEAKHSPFHGRLPQDIVSPAHRLRNPPNQPTFRAASAQKKASLFSVPPHPSHTNAALRKSRTSGHPLDMNALSSALSPFPSSTHHLPPNDNDDNDAMSVFSDLSPTKNFQNPRFFAQDALEETGLEGMMENAFRIDETPKEVREAHARDIAVANAMDRKEGMGRRVRNRSLLALGVVGVGLWMAVIGVPGEGGGQWGALASKVAGQTLAGIKSMVDM